MKSWTFYKQSVDKENKGFELYPLKIHAINPTICEANTDEASLEIINSLARSLIFLTWSVKVKHG